MALEWRIYVITSRGAPHRRREWRICVARARAVHTGQGPAADEPYQTGSLRACALPPASNSETSWPRPTLAHMDQRGAQRGPPLPISGAALPQVGSQDRSMLRRRVDAVHDAWPLKTNWPQPMPSKWRKRSPPSLQACRHKMQSPATEGPRVKDLGHRRSIRRCWHSPNNAAFVTATTSATSPRNRVCFAGGGHRTRTICGWSKLMTEIMLRRGRGA